MTHVTQKCRQTFVSSAAESIVFFGLVEHVCTQTHDSEMKVRRTELAMTGFGCALDEFQKKLLCTLGNDRARHFAVRLLQVRRANAKQEIDFDCALEWRRRIVQS